MLYQCNANMIGQIRRGFFNPVKIHPPNVNAVKMGSFLLKKFISFGHWLLFCVEKNKNNDLLKY